MAAKKARRSDQSEPIEDPHVEVARWNQLAAKLQTQAEDDVRLGRDASGLIKQAALVKQTVARIQREARLSGELDEGAVTSWLASADDATLDRVLAPIARRIGLGAERNGLA